VTGLCIDGEGIDRFIMEYAVQEMPRPVKWKIIETTGRSPGPAGEGAASSRAAGPAAAGEDVDG